jgi:predicted dehydrogenase
MKNIDRRDFLKNSTVLTTGIGLGLLSCKKEKFKLIPVSESERIRIGVIGVGYRGTDILKVLTQVPELKIIACCDILEFRIEEALAKVKLKLKTFTDYRKLLEDKEIDAVVISTPLHEHYRMVIDALAADKHILCEKALAYSIEQVQDIKLKATGYAKMIQVSYQYQLNPTYNVIKDIISKGHCGKITQIDGIWNGFNNWRRPVPSPELERQLNWRLYKEYSGGLMAEVGSHQLNLIDNIVGGHPSKVVGTGGIDYWKDGREINDNVHTLFDYPNGVKASFSATLANKFDSFTMKFRGDQATIVTSFMDEAYIYPEQDAELAALGNVDGVTGASIKLFHREKKKRISASINNDESYPFETSYLNATWILYKNFAAAIQGKEKLLLGLKDGHQSAIAVHMANDAINNEKVVRWLPEYDYY